MTLCSLFIVSCIFVLVQSLGTPGTPTKFSVPVFLTYPGMNNAGVDGTMIYDLSARTIAFKYPLLGYTEIYLFNAKLGYQTGPDQSLDQAVWKIAPQSACTPCAQYGNTYGFPLTNNTNWQSTGLIPTGITLVANTEGSLGADGCRRYDVPKSIGSFADYFYLNATTGYLCSLADQTGRLWTVTGDTSLTYDSNAITPPEGCKCLKPIDIAISLDRSSSITTTSTVFYKDFVQQLVNSFYFNSSDPVNTAQLSITQWGTRFWSLSSLGNLNFTTNPDNVNTASNLIGCTTRGGTCDFCFTCSNKKRSEFEEDETDDELIGDEVLQRTRSPTRAPTRRPTRAPTPAPTQAPPDCKARYECTAGQWTCTGCGIRGMAEQFTRVNTTYINRTKASKISIVITDGNSNTYNDGTSFGNNCNGTSNSSSPIGCYYDIHVQRNYLLSQVPGIQTFAIGVGSDIRSSTLDYISGDPERSFQESSFEALLDNLQKYVLGFCPLPNQTTECGSCCGFCECGVCVPPTRPIPGKFCDTFEVLDTPNAGGCFTTIPRTPCGPRSCNTVRCNAATETCDYTDLCAPGGPGQSPCFNYICYYNSTANFSSCQPQTYTCVEGSSNCPCPINYTNSPTQAPTTASPPVSFPTEAPTAPPCGGSCGQFGSCNSGECVCTDNYTGVFCGIPPDVDLCQTDADCFTEFCVTSVCVEGSTGGKVCQNSPKVCDDGNDCTTDVCLPESGCTFTDIDCDDGLGCTEDSCVAGVCQHVTYNCSYLDDACHTSFCDDFAFSADERCLKQAVTCERISNCSISECRLEDEGCVSEEYTCTPAFYGVVAGVAAGVIGGVVAAGAFILCAAATAGGGYAVSKNYDHDNDGAVHVSPLYKQSTKTGVGMAH